MIAPRFFRDSELSNFSFFSVFPIIFSDPQQNRAERVVYIWDRFTGSSKVPTIPFVTKKFELYVKIRTSLKFSDFTKKFVLDGKFQTPDVQVQVNCGQSLQLPFSIISPRELRQLGRLENQIAWSN